MSASPWFGAVALRRLLVPVLVFAVIGVFGVATARAEGQWRAAHVVDGRPVGYGCTQVRYVTRLAPGPSFSRSELNWAIRLVEQASGTDFQWVGNASEPWSEAWADRNPGVAHLGFATEAEFWLPTGASGYGASTRSGDGRTLDRGRVVLRPDHGWTGGSDTTNPLGLMFLHELGHLVGLAHVDSPDEVMTNRGNGTARRLGSGDRAGLRALGCPR